MIKRLHHTLKRNLDWYRVSYNRLNSYIRFNLLAKPHPNYARSYSQEGEDMVLRSLLGRRSKGFYVDVGAHHPEWYSNTKFFYDLGWRGINIDACPGSMDLFKLERTRDINLEVGVGNLSKSNFYIYNEPAVNTFDQSIVDLRKQQNYEHKVIDIKEVSLEPLSQILDQNLPNGQLIDFMSIDVEGKDLEVLESNNWEKYRPRFLLVERYGKDLYELDSDPLCTLLKGKNYVVVASTINTLILKNCD